MTVLRGARLVLPTGLVDEGWLAIRNGRIAALGGAGAPGDLPRPGPRDDHEEIDLDHRFVLPGFVDLHVHGGGGKSLTGASEADARAAVALHRAHGTTTTLASLVTAPLDEMCQAAAVLAGLAEERLIAGIHLEGPFLAEARCGAQDPASMLTPDPAALDRLLAAGRGYVRVVTVAPELPGALDLIRQVTDVGAVAAIGHTDATYEQTLAGIAAGATLATHLFNGMRGVHHREPGPATALLEHPQTVVELIADGVHLHGAITKMVFRHCGAGRVALITDAMAAAGAADGSYQLGPQRVRVSDGVAQLEGSGAIAGSTLTMDAALRRVVHAGVPITDAATALSTTPARVLGVGDRVGELVPGVAADLLVLGPELCVDGIMIGGEWHRKPF